MFRVLPDRSHKQPQSGGNDALGQRIANQTGQDRKGKDHQRDHFDRPHLQGQDGKRSGYGDQDDIAEGVARD